MSSRLYTISNALAAIVMESDIAFFFIYFFPQSGYPEIVWDLSLPFRPARYVLRLQPQTFHISSSRVFPVSSSFLSCSPSLSWYRRVHLSLLLQCALLPSTSAFYRGPLCTRPTFTYPLTCSLLILSFSMIHTMSSTSASSSHSHPVLFLDFSLLSRALHHVPMVTGTSSVSGSWASFYHTTPHNTSYNSSIYD